MHVSGYKAMWFSTLTCFKKSWCFLLSDESYKDPRKGAVRYKELFLKVMGFVTRMLLLSKVWTDFFFVYPPCLEDFLLYCSASQNSYLSQGFLQHMSSKTTNALSGTGISDFSSSNVERRRRVFWQYLKVHNSFYHFDFLQDFIPHWKSWTENVCDSRHWCWDLFQQPSAAWVAQGRRSPALAGVCAWTFSARCFSAQLLGWVLLCTFNILIPLPW